MIKIFKNIRSLARNKLIDDINAKHDNKESGVSGVLSALSDFRDYVMVLFENNEVMGAVSYYLSKKNNEIEVDHIGVIKQKCGYGTILMKEIFKLALKLKRHPVSLTTNGYSNEFYEKLGMERINDNKMPAIYEIKKEKLDNYFTYTYIS